MDINVDPSYSRTMAPDKALDSSPGGSTGHQVSMVWQWHGPQVPTWSQVTDQTPGILMVLVGTGTTATNSVPGYWVIDPDMALNNSPGPENTMALDDSTWSW